MLSLPALPKPGARIDLPPLAGSADALALAELAARNKGRTLAVITASAADAQRLLDEIPWFAPEIGAPAAGLGNAALRPLFAASGSRFRTPGHAVGGLAGRPGNSARSRVDRSQSAGPAGIHGRLHLRVQEGPEARRRQVPQPGHAGRLRHVTQVVSPGEYSIRGGLIDLFPMGSQLPYRLDLFDDEIESIKTFDVDTQRTVYPVPEVRLLPAREFPMDDKGRTHFRQCFRERFEGDPAKSGIYKDISTGIASAGIEYYLPLFFDEMASIFDYLPKDAIFVTHGDAPAAIAAFWNDTRSRYNLLQGDKGRPLLKPDELFLSDEAFFTAAKSYGRLAFSGKNEAVAARCRHCRRPPQPKTRSAP
jgi:transcription-repair coupling factor (superfamily II helicase)